MRFNSIVPVFSVSSFLNISVEWEMMEKNECRDQLGRFPLPCASAHRGVYDNTLHPKVKKKKVPLWRHPIKDRDIVSARQRTRTTCQVGNKRDWTFVISLSVILTNVDLKQLSASSSLAVKRKSNRVWLLNPYSLNKVSSRIKHRTKLSKSMMRSSSANRATMIWCNWQFNLNPII